jgi:hypothetical protein
MISTLTYSFFDPRTRISGAPIIVPPRFWTLGTDVSLAETVVRIAATPSSHEGKRSTRCRSPSTACDGSHSSNLAGMTKMLSSGSCSSVSNALTISFWTKPRLLTEFEDSSAMKKSLDLIAFSIERCHRSPGRRDLKSAHTRMFSFERSLKRRSADLTSWRAYDKNTWALSFMMLSSSLDKTLSIIPRYYAKK